MTAHQHDHDAHGGRFRIDVMPVATDDGDCIFSARAYRITGANAVPVRRRDGTLEIYGPTEEWALRNARALLDGTDWYEDAQA
jgi:hypothetical protein